MTPADTGSKPSRCCAERKGSGRHKPDNYAGRARSSRGLSRFVENLSHSAVGFGRLESGSGGDQSCQVSAIVAREFATSSARHKDTTRFGPQFGIGRVRSTLGPEQSIDLEGKKSRFTLWGALNCRRS
jgi:hypothetical protein